MRCEGGDGIQVYTGMLSVKYLVLTRKQSSYTA